MALSQPRHISYSRYISTTVFLLDVCMCVWDVRICMYVPGDLIYIFDIPYVTERR